MLIKPGIGFFLWPSPVLINGVNGNRGFFPDHGPPLWDTGENHFSNADSERPSSLFYFIFSIFEIGPFAAETQWGVSRGRFRFEKRRDVKKFVLLLDWGHFFHRLDLIWIIQFMNLISFNISLESIWKCDCNVTSPYHFYLPPIFATVLFICTKQQRTNRYISLHFFFYISVDLSQNRDGTHRADTAKTSLQNDSKKIK